MDRHEFLTAIDKIKPGLAKSALIEESEMVLFEPERIFSYNDEIAISCPFHSGLNGAIHAKELHQLLSRLKKDEIKVKKKGDEFQFVCGNTSAGFKMIEDMSPPPLGIDDIKAWNKLPSDFSDALGFCVFSAASNIGMGLLTCVKAEGDEMLSCDNYRATQYQMKGKLAKGVCLYIPQSTVGPLINHGPNKVHVTQSWIHFINPEGITFSCRTMDGEFPDISALMSEKGSKVDLPEDMKDIMARTETLTDQSAGQIERLIEINIVKGNMICRGEGPAGWVEEKTKIKYNGKKLNFVINSHFFSQILDQVNEVQIGERYLTFNGENFNHVMLQLNNG